MKDSQTATVCETAKSTEALRMMAVAATAIVYNARRIAEAWVLKRDDQLLGPRDFNPR